MKKTYLKLILSTLLSASISISVMAYEVLDIAASKSPLVPYTLMYDIAKAGDRFVAVGMRGHIILSDDKGKTWRQAENVPVRSDLLSVTFTNSQEGWVSGHDTVIMHTTDAGENWELQFDGRSLGENGVNFFQAKYDRIKEQLSMCADKPQDLAGMVAATECEELEALADNYDMLIGEMGFAREQGADKPLFNMLCREGKTDTACSAGGAYGIILRTVDGGKTWVNRMDKIENPDFVHIFYGAPIGASSFLVSGEMGNVWRAEVVAEPEDAFDYNLHLIPTPYSGSLFSVAVANDGSYIVAGLSGNMFRSVDEGETWVEIVDKPKSGNLIDALVLSDGRILFVAQTGQIIISDDNGETFKLGAQVQGRIAVAAVESGPGELLVATSAGVIQVNLDK